jgi:hypothetical protein
MKTTDFRDCQRFADAITSVGGTVPPPLANLLSAHTLLASPASAQRPETDILTHALDGTLDQKMLDKLLAAAATAQIVNTYRAELARQSEHTLLGQFHRELEAGAGEEILDSMRERFDENAQAIAKARSLIDPESSAEHILASAAPEMVEAWQTLDGHLRVVNKIAAIASQFGPRLGSFPQITEYSLGHNHLLEDRAIMCTDGPLLADSAAFRRPDQGHRTSPWSRVALRLHTVESAQARYNAWAAGEFDRLHSGPQESWIDEHGKMHERPRPENPFKVKAST